MGRRGGRISCVFFLLTICIPAFAIERIEGTNISKIAGDVYRFHYNGYYSLIVLTDDGVVVADPINAIAATKLKSDVKKISGKPISHLIYSHSHTDHASGGAVLKATTVIAHEAAPAKLNGVTPTVRFKDKHAFSLGSKQFELTWLGKGHGEDSIAVVVRPENTAFIVDIVTPKRLPYRDFPGTDIDGMINQLQVIESLDFETLIPGHGIVGTKADATETRVYVQSLREQVLAGLKAGKTVGELKQSITMDDYDDWARGYLKLNISGMARYLEKHEDI